jgi:hypothetical protein
MELWNNLAPSTNNPALSRPPISAIVDNNITVISSWLGSDAPDRDVEASEQHGRIGTH